MAVPYIIRTGIVPAPYVCPASPWIGSRRNLGTIGWNNRTSSVRLS
jgi:hypothetical protein